MATIPSLALIPSGYKGGSPGTLYSVLPTDGSGDFDFTRSGNATRVNSDGLIELVTTNVPRLNYPLIDGVVQGCPSLLLEPQRINVIQYSEDFSQGYWTKDGSSVTSGFISPDGTANAFKIVENSSNSFHRVGIATFTANVYRTLSFFAKKGERNYVSLFENNTVNPARKGVIFDLENGAFYNNNESFYFNAQIENYGNGWYRCSAYFQNTGLCVPSIGISADGLTNSYQGDGTSGIYIWGAQLEEAIYPTSYIPNYGTALGATRSAETCNNAGDVNTFNDSEGVLFAEISALADDGTARVITINDGGSSDYIGLRYHTVSNTVRFLIKSGGTINFDYFITLPSTLDSNKIAIKYDNTNVYLWANGIQYFQYSPITTPIGLSTLDFDDSLGNDDFYGKTKQLQYFDSALNDSDLETLTSWDSFSDMAIGQLYTIE
jgi:hypothetical protein